MPGWFARTTRTASAPMRRRAGCARRRHGRLQRRRGGERDRGGADQQGDARHRRADPALRHGPGTGELMAARILRNVVARANTSIFQAASSQPQYAGMGTTLVVALLQRQPDHRGPRRRFAPVPAARRAAEPAHARPFPAAGADRQRHDHQGDGAALPEQEPGHPRGGHRARGGGRHQHLRGEGRRHVSAVLGRAATTWWRTRTSSSRWARCRPICRWRRASWCRWRTTTVAATTSR